MPYFAKPHMKLLSKHVFSVWEAVSKFLQYLKDQVARTSEVQSNIETEASAEDILVQKIKAVRCAELFWKKVSLILKDYGMVSRDITPFLSVLS